MSSDPIDLLAFKKQFYQFVESKSWEKASRHHLGRGLENGAYFDAALKSRKRLKHSKDPMGLAVLDLVVTAGLWTNQRCHQAGYEIGTA